MKAVCLHDQGTIEAFLRRDPFLHLYEIGDLDDAFWPFTTWYAWAEGTGDIRAVALVFSKLAVPTLLALSDGGARPQLEALLRSITPLLPRRFHAHLSPGLSGVLEGPYMVASHGEHLKMALTDPAALNALETSEAAPLSAAQADEMLRLYNESYPGHRFEPASVEANLYCGLRVDGRLVSAAGTHVHSARHRVAALGNVATHPGHRGRGYARQVVGRLCRKLRESADHIGLNVKADNQPAVRCYRSLGFSVTAAYEECALELA